ncbi:hypothetical protein RRG08_036080 [Elysia crispata]|uniref:Uncharacterized protein n=1 Tax=Elysia crispata TaxID=231223 RepID=A0AAE1AL55_9GAST|nr:hypothetical protein RRG08_036080 [Elysia crispata]
MLALLEVCKSHQTVSRRWLSGYPTGTDVASLPGRRVIALDDIIAGFQSHTDARQASNIRHQVRHTSCTRQTAGGERGGNDGYPQPEVWMRFTKDLFSGLTIS